MPLVRASALAALALVTLAFATPASAQSALDVADAKSFMGGWTLGLDTPQGSMSMDLALTDAGGKVAAKLTAEDGPAPGTTEIKDITRDADKLVLRYMLNFQGMEIPSEITLVPVGDKWKAAFNFASGQFMVDGTAIKK